ncbi:MAG: hypothetical protein JWO59_54 [Chloroflexi bacterium]|nr:hypothetical protein [Chloroflexota bacterium]
MAPEEECEHEMFVLMRWERHTLAVPLSQLAVTDVDDKTRQAVEDWQYWDDDGDSF